MIPGESSRSEAVSTKAKYTAMHLNETGDRRVERGLVNVDGRREGEKMSVVLCVSERKYAQETPWGRNRKNNREE